MDEEIAQLTATQIKAGDPSDAVKNDGFDASPYCFNLKTDHTEGALSAIAKYVPWWKDLERSWGPLNDCRLRFKSWTKSKKTGTKSVNTHACMNGGELCIQFGADEDLFLESYTKCLLAGFRMYFVERLNYEWDNKCFRLYVDLDFEQLRGITERGVEAAASICASAVARFFPTRSSLTIVCATTYKEKIKTNVSGNKVARIKTGVHLHWPEHFVTKRQALNIRESLLSDLTEAFGIREEPEKNQWEDVVDRSVYENNGLRMTGSCKTEPCKKCKKDPQCDQCQGQGRFLDLDVLGRPRPYMMLCVLNKPDQDFNVRGRDLSSEDFYRKNMLELIKATKIRTAIKEDQLDNGYELPKGAPIFAEDLKKSNKRPSGSKNERAIDSSDPCTLEIQSILRSAFGDIYKQIVVKKISKGLKKYTVIVTGNNCRFCQNIGREHNSNNIYFIISRDGIYQKCFDDGPRTAEMQYGLCKDYAGGGIALSQSTSTILWPPELHDDLSVFGTQMGVALSTKRGFNGDFLLKALLNTGEYLCNQLYNESWSATLGLRSRNGRGGRLKEFLPQDSRDLGSRGVGAFKTLGFEWAEALIAKVDKPVEQQTPIKINRPISEFEVKLMEAFDTLVVLACASDDPDIYRNCEFLDDILAI
jgi:hypothetical protein